jgi:hypothetical protein
MTSPTLKQLREEARRVFGPTATVTQSNDDCYTDIYVYRCTPSISACLIMTEGTRTAARRFALETLKALPSKEKP